MDLDLAVLLRSLGLERYETAFREKAITEEVLPSVSGGAPDGNFRLQARWLISTGRRAPRASRAHSEGGSGNDEL